MRTGPVRKGECVVGGGSPLLHQPRAIVKYHSALDEDVPKGGGKVQLFWAPQGSAYTAWVSSVTPVAWYSRNPGWKLEDPIGSTTPTPGKFDGGVLTLLPLQPGAFIDYVLFVNPIIA